MALKMCDSYGFATSATEAVFSYNIIQQDHRHYNFAAAKAGATAAAAADLLMHRKLEPRPVSVSVYSEAVYDAHSEGKDDAHESGDC